MSIFIAIHVYIYIYIYILPPPYITHSHSHSHSPSPHDSIVQVKLQKVSLHLRNASGCRLKALMKGREGHSTCLQIPDKFYLQVCNALQPTNRRKGCGSNRSIALYDLMKWGCVSLHFTLRHAPFSLNPNTCTLTLHSLYRYKDISIPVVPQVMPLLIQIAPKEGRHCLFPTLPA